MKERGLPVVPVIVLTSVDATITSLRPHSKFLRWDLFVILIIHKETQVYTLVTENWTWSFSPSTCRITACTLLISRFAWRTIKQTNNLLLIIKTKQNKKMQSFLINLAISELPQASVLKWGEVQSHCRYENDFSFLYANKTHFMTKALHLASFWKWLFLELC